MDRKWLYLGHHRLNSSLGQAFRHLWQEAYYHDSGDNIHGGQSG